MQSRTHSLVEACLNTASGFIISVFVQFGVSWYYNLSLSFGQNVLITLVFTVVSVLRSYFWRRYFNRRIINATQNPPQGKN